jgi:hypothetical protein
MTLDKVVEQLRSEVAEAGSETAWAHPHGISQSYVNFVLRNAISPGPKLLKALGLKKVISYEKV